jgi:uncharacterized protein (DUF1499 family)
MTNERAPAERLAPCPESPNCVSTLATDPDKAMPPLLYDVPEEDVMEAIAEVVASSPRVRIVERGPRYLHAEYESLVFRFVDDVEIAVDPERHRVDFRSASRKGYSDLGVNRRRMEKLSRRLAERPGISIAGAP